MKKDDKVLEDTIRQIKEDSKKTNEIYFRIKNISFTDTVIRFKIYDLNICEERKFDLHYRISKDDVLVAVRITNTEYTIESVLDYKLLDALTEYVIQEGQL